MKAKAMGDSAFRSLSALALKVQARQFAPKKARHALITRFSAAC